MVDYATPPHGDRVWAVGEIDHTPLDLSLVSSVTGAVLGTAYLSVLIDAFTRMPLALRPALRRSAALSGSGTPPRVRAAVTGACPTTSSSTTDRSSAQTTLR